LRAKLGEGHGRDGHMKRRGQILAGDWAVMGPFLSEPLPGMAPYETDPSYFLTRP